jgi:hypothetical protein
MKKNSTVKLQQRFKWVGLAILGLVCFSLISMKPSDSGFRDFSGEEIFQGLFFLDGPVVNAIPELKEKVDVKKLLDIKGEETDRKMMEILSVEIKKTNPKYFDHFKEEMTSGSQLRIQKELAASQETIYRAISSYLGIKLSDLMSAKEQLAKIFAGKQEELLAQISDLQSGKISKDEFEKRLVQMFPKDGKDILAGNPSSKLCCVPFLTVIACNFAVVINVAGYFNVVLSAAVAVAVAGAVTIYFEAESVKSESNYKYNSLINSVAVNLGAPKSARHLAVNV